MIHLECARRPLSVRPLPGLLGMAPDLELTYGRAAGWRFDSIA
jgi:hypothetical protein